MQSTWRSSPSARSRSPTARAVLPPTPASISSKTSVPAPAPPPKPLSASITRESSPPEAASRSGAGSQARVRRQPQLDRLGAVEAEAVWVGLQHDLESRPGHRQSLQLLGHLALQRRRGFRPAVAELVAELGPARLGLGQRRLDLRPALLGALQAGDLGSAALGVGENGLDAAAVLALQPVERLEPLFDRGKATRVGLQALEVAAQLAARRRRARSRAR